MDMNGISNAAIAASYDVVRNVIFSTFEIPGRYSADRLLCVKLGIEDDRLVRAVYRPAEDAIETQVLSWRETEARLEVDQEIDGIGVGTLILTPGSSDPKSTSHITLMGDTPNSIAGEPKARCAQDIAANIERILQDQESVPDWVANFYRVLDSMDADAFVGLLNKDCEFRTNAQKYLRGAHMIREDSINRWSSRSGLNHHLSKVMTLGAVTGIECATSYQRRSDNCWRTVPAGVFITRRQEEIMSVRIYADGSLLEMMWPMPAQ